MSNSVEVRGFEFGTWGMDPATNCLKCGSGAVKMTGTGDDPYFLRSGVITCGRCKHVTGVTRTPAPELGKFHHTLTINEDGAAW